MIAYGRIATWSRRRATQRHAPTDDGALAFVASHGIVEHGAWLSGDAASAALIWPDSKGERRVAGIQQPASALRSPGVSAALAAILRRRHAPPPSAPRAAAGRSRNRLTQRRIRGHAGCAADAGIWRVNPVNYLSRLLPFSEDA